MSVINIVKGICALKEMSIFGSNSDKKDDKIIYSMNSENGNIVSGILGTSKGVLLKWDYVKNDLHYYIKAGKSNGIYLSNLEPIAENIAYRLGEKLGVDVVRTGLLEHTISEGYHGLKGQDCLLSYSLDFKTNKQDVFIPAIDLVDISEFTYSDLGTILNGFREEINKMLVFDFIIGNYDRHLNNFGILTNADRTDLKFSPIFDNGSSLLSNFNDIELLELSPKDIDKYSIAKPFKRTQLEQFNLIKDLPKLNYAITSEEIEDIVNDYAYDLKEYRRKRIINLIERRLNYVRKIYSEKC